MNRLTQFHPAPSRFRLQPLAAAAATLLSGFAIGVPGAGAQVLPVAPSVVHGSAAVSTNGQQMLVTNSPNAIINWQAFSIGAQNAVRFQQQGSSSQVLNRVTGNDLSSILGSLSSNGKVWLVNPNGVVFGQGARIDVGGLVASTLAISNEDFLSGKYAFQSMGPGGAVVNKGDITTPLGGRVWLVGENVSNEGSITSHGGSVVLAAGKSVELVDSAAPNVRVKLTAPENEALNLGSILASGGTVDLHGGIVNQQGVIRADSMAVDAAGRITLLAKDEVRLAAGSETTANGPVGGAVRIEALEGLTDVAGKVTATGSVGAGGQLAVLGERVRLLPGTEVDASGATRGGSILLGGDYQGMNPDVHNARQTLVARGASVAADAKERGDGGRIIVWGTETAQVYGAVSARGGTAGGNGGFLETSGGSLDVRPSNLDVRAGPGGRGGSWLIDPNNITITSSDGDDGFTYSNLGTGQTNFGTSGDDTRIGAGYISNEIESGNSVTIRTGTFGANSQPGDITFASDLYVSRSSLGPALGGLTLEAHRDINLIGHTILSSGGAMPLTLRADFDQNGEGITYLANSRVMTNGGNISMSGGGPLSRSNGVIVANSVVDAGRGTVTFAGRERSPAGLQEVPGGTIISGDWLPGAAVTSSSVSGGRVEVQGDSASFWRASVNAGASGFNAQVANGFSAVESSVIRSNGELSLRGASVELNGSIASAAGDFIIDATNSASVTTSSVASSGGSLHVLGPQTAITQSSLVADQFVYVGAANMAISSSSLSSTGDVQVVGGNVSISGSSLDAGGEVYLNAANGSLSSSIIGARSFRSDDEGKPSGAYSYVDTTVNATDIHIYADSFAASGTTRLVANNDVPLVLAAGSFSNTAGPDLLSNPLGGWRVYLPQPQDVGGLPYYFEQFNAPAFTNPTPQAAGNRGLFYASPFSMTVTLGSKGYDGTTALPVLERPAWEYGCWGTYCGEYRPSAEPGIATFFDKNVAYSGRQVVPKPVSYGGNVAILGARLNYVYGVNVELQGVITPRVVSLTGVQAQDKIYDGTAQARGTYTVSGLLGSDSISAAVTGTFGSAGGERPKDVASGKPVTFTLALDGADLGNYVLATPALGSYTSSASITPRPLTAEIAALGKVYDGNASASANVVLSGLLPGDQVTSSASGTFRSKGTERPQDVASDKPVAVTINLGGVDASNYSIGPAGGTASITPRPLSLSGLTVLDKVYDGNATANVNATGLSNVVEGDAVSAGSLTGTFGSKGSERPKDVANDKPVFITGSLAGPNANNYTLGPAGGTADITAKTLTISGATAADKVYDRTTDATITPGSLQGVVPGDDLRLTGAVGGFATRNVGTQAVTIQGFDLIGADRGNYTLAANSLTTTATITPRPLTGVTVTGSVNKVYDATAAASLATGQYALGGVIAGDVVTVTGPAQGVYDNANVGTGKAVTATGPFQLGGADAGNYQLPPNLAARGNVGIITPATLTYVADPALRFQGSDVSGIGGTVTGLRGSDTLTSQTTGSLSWTSPANPTSSVGTYPIVGSGLTSSNYVFVQDPRNAAALTVAPAPGVGGLTSGGFNDTVVSSIELGMRSTLPTLSFPTGGSVFDIITGGGRELFGAINVSGRSEEELSRILESRRQFKRKLFADAIYKLELDPTLADVPVCPTIDDGAAGNCRYSDEQVAQLQKQRAAPTEAATPARKGALPQIHRKIALFFGVSEYADKKIPSVDTALPDVDAVSSVVAQRMGYEPRVIRNPTKQAIVAALNRAAAELGPEDSLLIYYSGHGYTLERNGAGYWLPSDAPVDDPKQWISNVDIAKLLAAVPSKQVALVTDSCYSAAFTREGAGGVGQGASADELLTKRAVVVLASGGDEPVSDESKEGHSIFAWNLMNTLKSVENWRPGANVFTEVQTSVRKELPQTPRYGAVSAAGHQAGGDYLFEQR